MKQEEVFSKLQEILKKQLTVDIEITPETALVHEKVLDSLEFMNYITTIEDEFGIELSDEDIENKQLGLIKNMVDFLAE